MRRFVHARATQFNAGFGDPRMHHFTRDLPSALPRRLAIHNASRFAPAHDASDSMDGTVHG
jgi:hypothetical protein